MTDASVCTDARCRGGGLSVGLACYRFTRPAEVPPYCIRSASNKVIARRLAISLHTATFHVAAILAKLDADSRTEAVARAAHLGLVML